MYGLKPVPFKEQSSSAVSKSRAVIQSETLCVAKWRDLRFT
jgi:hypothetical protein